MNFLQFKEQLHAFTVFSIADIRVVYNRFDLRRLTEWQEKGYIKKVVKGYYVFSDLNLNEQALFEIANRSYSPSYVSLEMALSQYGIIPEGVYAVTSIATRRTYSFHSEVADFSYKTLRPELFFGYNITSHPHGVYKIARAEKAVLDYFYLNPQLKTESDMESLRYHPETFQRNVNQRALKTYLKRFSSPALGRRIKCLLKVMGHD